MKGENNMNTTSSISSSQQPGLKAVQPQGEGDADTASLLEQLMKLTALRAAQGVQVAAQGGG